jgi:PhnB protein
MQVSPYLSFDGQCEAAFKFYERCLGAKIGEMFRYAGSPMGDQVPADWQDKVMHGSVTVGDLVLMGGDVAPGGYEPPRGFSLSIQIQDPAEAGRIFGEMSNGGTVTMPLEKTFWAERFGMVIDPFGIPWLINCEAPERPAEG